MKDFTSSLRAGLALVLALTAASTVRAQTINVTGTAVGVPSGPNYNYNLTVNNDVSSTDPIQTVWFAWVSTPYDLLPSQPANVTAPTGWTAYVLGTGSSPYDGFSIEFTTQNSLNAINPGGTAQFGFTSSVSPTSLNGYSQYPFFGYYQMATTYAYEGAASGPAIAPDGDSQGFLVAAAAPEPSTFGLLALGGAALFAARRKFRPAVGRR